MMAGAAGAPKMALLRSASRISGKRHAGRLLPAACAPAPLPRSYSSVAESGGGGDKRLNLAAWKRGTGGRSSFNGVVATVFGATGFVGNYVVNQLGKCGTQLILPYKCDHYECMKLKLAGDLGQVLFHEFNLRDQKSIEKAVQYSNVVINLVGRDWETRNFTYRDVHVEGARNIARAAKNAGVKRFIHLSYLNSEEDPEPLVMPRQSKWKMTKWEGEQVVREEFPEATIIKAADIYGQEDRFLTYFNHLFRRDGKYMFLWKNGEQTEKQPIFVTDVAKAIARCAQDPDTAGQVYQAVGPKRYRLDHMVDWFFALMRMDAEWGYRRHDLKYNPFFKLKFMLNDLSPSYPLGNVTWEALERECTSDVIKKDIPTLDDLGINLTPMEEQVPWELYPHRAYAYYYAAPGDFPTPAAPPTIPIV